MNMVEFTKLKTPVTKIINLTTINQTTHITFCIILMQLIYYYCKEIDLRLTLFAKCKKYAIQTYLKQRF